MVKATLALGALLLMGWFTVEITDTDFWWHLKTGESIAQTQRLPVPDRFAYTTEMGGPAYPGEWRTRYFNLTHEWLTQVMFYGVWRAAGFPGVVLFRALLLTLFCGLVGLMAWRRSGGVWRAAPAAMAAAGVMGPFALDRPFLVTFVLLALTIATLEFGRGLWLLPLILLVWANCHGGYFLGWVALGAYAAEPLVRRQWRAPVLLPAAVAVAVSGLNPNGFRIVPVLSAYRGSYMTSRLLEWAPTSLWPPHWYTVLLVGAAATLVWARRRVRLADWLLFAAFTGAALSAARNVILIGLMAPVLLAAYAPVWKRRVPAAVLPVAMGAALAWGVGSGRFFQLRVADWKWPAGAADFLIAHGVTQPMFNTYEHGGYLIWRLWPQERVFIDGRSLNESVFLDYARILYNHDETGGKSGMQLLDQYGVETIVMNTFEPVTGNIYLIAPALADPQQSDWKLVYSDPAAVVLMRHPPAGVEVLPSLAILEHMEAECGLHLEHEPQYPRCARSLGQVFLKVGDTARARRWLGNYLRLPHEPDAEAEGAFRGLMGR